MLRLNGFQKKRNKLPLHLLPEKTALVCSVDTAVVEPVKKPGKDIWEW